MLLLRREYRDGAESPEIVLLHAEVTLQEGPVRRFTRAVVAPESPGRRVVHLPLPEPGRGERVRVRYRFSTVLRGEERTSPPYEEVIPSDDAIGDLYRIQEEEAGNLPPAPGLEHFLLLLPLAEGEHAAGSYRYGFGAMRKKPSPALCRASICTGNGMAPLIEVPEALSVLKNRPMPYFLYHLSGDGILRSDKIACARITLPDPDGSVVSARMVWGDPAWRATNFSLMEAKGCVPDSEGTVGGLRWRDAREEFFTEDREAFYAAREAVLSLLPGPRVFEAFVFGPSGSGVEYCFQTVSRRPGGGFEVRWRNRDGGGNWTVTL
jgi:hypothetical protein